MSTLDNPKALFQRSCSTNSEPYALQNIGDMMSPEFNENCIIIIDPSMPIHNEAYVIIDFKDELYFRQYFEENGKKLIKSINSWPKEKLLIFFSIFLILIFFKSEIFPGHITPISFFEPKGTSTISPISILILEL